MTLSMEKSWKQPLESEFDQPYFKGLVEFIKEEYTMHTCYPPDKRIFAAFDHSQFEKTKVVILGQDPYHGPHQANGLCFSVSDGIPHPPSLVNIFKEIAADLGNPYPKSGNLERWADQGVLLLNAILTVRAHEAGSHQRKGWETFTDNVIRAISEEREGIVFLLWGGHAKKKSKLIDGNKHHILTSGHPSPLSANRGYWFGNRHFSTTNALLEQMGKAPIDW
ncbi:uracil-DNA glycosylase [Maribacter polysaccharolyticus]|uniref:uracil-DNA glycosylase n=1 Tax=Maribacter polysaccharolyticus TaxID=3020831 RepID=UPI00237F975D|nr:uracil-DNA glycosylase [Maribacter polysaccharolyticus]MDE3740549.1 uracil-DNA glycosylase [Maribacter polysaccharolyticus]